MFLVVAAVQITSPGESELDSSRCTLGTPTPLRKKEKEKKENKKKRAQQLTVPFSHVCARSLCDGRPVCAEHPG
jgi:hypothetical protein